MYRASRLLLVAATAAGCVYPSLKMGTGGTDAAGGTTAAGGGAGGSAGGTASSSGGTIVSFGGTTSSTGGTTSSSGGTIISRGGTTSSGGATALGGSPNSGGVTRTGSPTPGGGTSGGGGGTSGGLGGGGDAGALGDAAVATCVSIADDLIADFTRDNSLNPVDGRQGVFYVQGDGSLAGEFDPPLPHVSGQPYPIDTTTGNPACSGPGSLHTKATGWGVWGADLGTDFVPKVLTEAGVGPLGTGFKGTYDASKYSGISFWAKATAPLTGVQVTFGDAYTDGGATFAGLPVPDGTDPDFTSCVYILDPRYNCSPYLVKFGSDPQYFPAYQNYQIDTTWKRFDVFFADTRQDQYNLGFHAAADLFTSNLDVTHLTAMTIRVTATSVNGPPTPNDFEIWVDDVNFIR